MTRIGWNQRLTKSSKSAKRLADMAAEIAQLELDAEETRKQIDQAQRIADEQWERASEALDAQSAAEARREAIEAETAQIHQKATGEAQRAAERLLASAREEAATLRNSTQLADDGAANFEIAVNEVAADLSLTNDLYDQARTRAFKDDRGRDRRFAKDEDQDGLVKGFIMFGFNKAVALFNKISGLVRFHDEIARAQTFPEPLMQMQNVLDATREAVSETLTQLGIADKRVDVGERDEKGDPPPVLELVFSRAARKAKQLNKELAARLGPPGPGMR